MNDYETDVLAWSERQAALLRRLAAGERVNDRDLDWPNIAEEIQDAGLSSLRAFRSLLIQVLAHEMKAAAWPASVHAARWRHDAGNFRLDAREVFTPSMRQKIDLAAIYRRALRELPPEIDGCKPLPLPAVCPATLDELIAGDG
ncbi:MAG TPA: DUF29 domain-containing protein [Acetobacteraceae bacterium]|nr:DUF29 domain-containing protein [Acetobacteraceae bacterium]